MWLRVVTPRRHHEFIRVYSTTGSLFLDDSERADQKRKEQSYDPECKLPVAMSAINVRLPFLSNCSQPCSELHITVPAGPGSAAGLSSGFPNVHACCFALKRVSLDYGAVRNVGTHLGFCLPAVAAASTPH
jgi:hypothetical protein